MVWHHVLLHMDRNFTGILLCDSMHTTINYLDWMAKVHSMSLSVLHCLKRPIGAASS